MAPSRDCSEASVGLAMPRRKTSMKSRDQMPLSTASPTYPRTRMATTMDHRTVARRPVRPNTSGVANSRSSGRVDGFAGSVTKSPNANNRVHATVVRGFVDLGVMRPRSAV